LLFASIAVIKDKALCSVAKHHQVRSCIADGAALAIRGLQTSWRGYNQFQNIQSSRMAARQADMTMVDLRQLKGCAARA
jgi:hypothetical protein